MPKKKELNFEDSRLEPVSAWVPEELLRLCNKLAAQRILEDRPHSLSQMVRDGLTLLVTKELK